MHDLEADVLSIVLLLFIFFDVRRFPLPKKDKGSIFFAELSVIYSIFLVISLLVYACTMKFMAFPMYVERSLWALHVISFPFMLLLWAHFNAINVIEDRRKVSIHTKILVAPLVALSALMIADIPPQYFFVFGRHHEHLPKILGSYLIITLSLLYCLAMILIVLINIKELPGSRLFLFMLTPSTLLISIVFFWYMHDHTQFTVVSSFLLILNYLIIHRDSVVVDTLTNLPTKSLFNRRLLKIFRLQLESTVIILDIENFRFFNKRYGRVIGDRMLAQVAEFLVSLEGRHETYRFDNDCFCICIPKSDRHMVEGLVQQIEERMQNSWQLDVNHVHIQINCAIIDIPEQASDYDEFKNAVDQLFIEIKSGRRENIIIYNRENSINQQKKLDIVSALRDSIRNPEQVKVYFQPIYNVNDSRMVSAEALMRIQDSNLGFLTPGEFVPIAEQTGLIIHLTEIVLSKVCTVINQLSKEKNIIDHISVNLSGEDFSSTAISKKLMNIISKEGVNPERIGFEITESMMLQSYEEVAKVIIEMSLKKVTFALDDFGKGYSNLQVLMELPYNYVKIDRSVIAKSTINPKMLTLLTEMLHKMEKQIVAEGVETEEELALIKRIGIERVQGYYFSKPLPEVEFLELVKRASTIVDRI